MIDSLADAFHVPIKWRIKSIFLVYSSVSVGLTYFVWFDNSIATDWDIVYRILYPLSFLSCLYMVFYTSIGKGNLYLFPLVLASLIRVVDVWQNFLSQTQTFSFESALLGTAGWLLLAVSVAYVDLLESRIYHKLINLDDK